MLLGVLDVVVAAGAAASTALWLWSGRARRAEAADAARSRAIADAREGHFRIRGRVVPLETTTSEIDGARCVYVLRGSVDPSQGIVRDVHYELVAFPFRVEDETGVVEIDPRAVVVDAPPAHGEAGLIVEHRLVAGEEVEVAARFRPCARGCVPYRGDSPLLEPVPDAMDPPRVSPIKEAMPSGALPAIDRAVTRAAAVGVLGASIVLAWLMG